MPAEDSSPIIQLSGSQEATATPATIRASPAHFSPFPLQAASTSSALPLPFPFPPYASDSLFSPGELPEPPSIASTSAVPVAGSLHASHPPQSTASTPAVSTGGAVDDPHPGFPTVSGFEQQRISYLDSLDQKKKRAKALVDTELYDFVRSTLLHPQDTSLRSAQDRFWARATFTLARKGEEPSSASSASAAASVLASLSTAKPPTPPPSAVNGTAATSSAVDFLADFSTQPIASTLSAPSPPPTASSSTAKSGRTSRRPGRPAVSTPSFLPLITDAEGNPVPVDEASVVVIHDGMPVAKSEEIYEILVDSHRKMEHGGREKTFKEVRTKWAWVPKELVARFIKICPTCISNSTPGVKWRNQSGAKRSGSSSRAKKAASGKGLSSSAGGRGKGKKKTVEEDEEDVEEDGGDEQDAEGESVGGVEDREEDGYVPETATKTLGVSSGRLGARTSTATASAGPTSSAAIPHGDALPSPAAGASPPPDRPAKKAKAAVIPSERGNRQGSNAHSRSPVAAGHRADHSAASSALPPPPPLPPTFVSSPHTSNPLPVPLPLAGSSDLGRAAPPAHPSQAYQSSPVTAPAPPVYTPYQPFATGALAPAAVPAYAAFPTTSSSSLQHPAYSGYASSLHSQLQPPSNGFVPSSSPYTSAALPVPPNTYASYSIPTFPPSSFPVQQQQEQPIPNGAGSLSDVIRAAEQAQAWAAANPSLLVLPVPPFLGSGGSASGTGPSPASSDGRLTMGEVAGGDGSTKAVDSLKRPFEDILPLPLPPSAPSAKAAAVDRARAARDEAAQRR
ncbi:hypothetical protein JCM11251_005645 [Rhodosporidiobolus azoricus]